MAKDHCTRFRIIKAIFSICEHVVSLCLYCIVLCRVALCCAELCVWCVSNINSVFTCTCGLSRSQGTYRLLNAVGPFQCCITIELRLSSDIDDIITVLVLQLKLLWFDFLAISSLLLFFSDLPMAHKRFRNRNDETIRPDAIITPHAIIAIGSTVFSDEFGKMVVSDVLFDVPCIELLPPLPLAVCVSLPASSSSSVEVALNGISFVPFPFGFDEPFDLCGGRSLALFVVPATSPSPSDSDSSGG